MPEEGKSRCQAIQRARGCSQPSVLGCAPASPRRSPCPSGSDMCLCLRGHTRDSRDLHTGPGTPCACDHRGRDRVTRLQVTARQAVTTRGTATHRNLPLSKIYIGPDKKHNHSLHRRGTTSQPKAAAGPPEGTELSQLQRWGSVCAVCTHNAPHHLVPTAEGHGQHGGALLGVEWHGARLVHCACKQ